MLTVKDIIEELEKYDGDTYVCDESGFTFDKIWYDEDGEVVVIE